MKNIFLGLTDISSQILTFRTAFSSLGYNVLDVIYSASAFNSVNDYSYCLYEIRNKKIKDFPIFKNNLFVRKYYSYTLRKQFLKKAIAECDYFILFWNSLRNDYSDYSILKKYNKKIVTYFCGDDIRWYPAMKQDFSRYNMKPIEFPDLDLSLSELNKRLRYLRIVEKHSDIIYGGPNLSQLALRPYNFFAVPINLDEIKYNPSQKESNPIIIHAPSNPKVKGTEYILKAIERLKYDNLNFDFKLVKNLPYNQVLNLYSESDILVGQMLAAGGGKQEREALAAGCVVLTSVRYDYPQNIPSDCPMIDVNPDNLYEELKKIIIDYPRRVELAKRGRLWVEKYHDVKGICKDIINRLETGINKPDFYPTFFRDDFIPESVEAVKVYNKWNRYVENCGWYKEFVKPGKRSGLNF